jgi:serine/threonine-protein kinase
LEQVGKYRIVAEIGQGGTSHVYKAYDPALDRHVAVKVIAAEARDDDTRRRRFEREAQAAALLNHRHIVKVYDFGREGDTLYIAMELLEGMDLRRALAEGQLGLAERLDVAQQVADGLAFAHLHGIVHRDLKPANIHLLPDGQAKIMDFGLARLRGSDITRSGMVMGTPHYMSPEQVRGEHVDARSDVFSLGSILYEMLARQKPFDGDSVHSVLYKVMQADPTPITTMCPDLPAGLPGLVERAMARAAAERFSDGGELGESLAAVRQASVGGRGGESARPPDVAPARSAVAMPASSRSTKPITHWLAALVVVALVLATVAIARRPGRRSPDTRGREEVPSHSEVDALTRTLVEAQIELARKKLASGEPAEAVRQAGRALKLDRSSSAAKEVLAAARQANDRVVGTALTETRAALTRGDTAGAAAAFWRLLQADPDHAAAGDLVPALDRALESEARLARSTMEEARRAAEKASGGHADGYEEGAALARDGEAALLTQNYAAAARAFMQARDRFRRAMP